MKIPSKILLLFFAVLLSFQGRSSQILVPMDEAQRDHLKAYGLAYWTLENQIIIEWLLNYRGGSFLIPHLQRIEEELLLRNISYQVLADGQVNKIKSEIADPEVNMEVVQLEKAPK
ncbi:MAG: asparagine synthetase B, partial [Flavobacteriia bacterium]